MKSKSGFPGLESHLGLSLAMWLRVYAFCNSISPFVNCEIMITSLEFGVQKDF